MQEVYTVLSGLSGNELKKLIDLKDDGVYLALGKIYVNVLKQHEELLKAQNLGDPHAVTISLCEYQTTVRVFEKILSLPDMAKEQVKANEKKD